MTTTTHQNTGAVPPCAPVTGGGAFPPPGLAATLFAAENSNFAGLHALHDMYADATGADRIPASQIIPESEADAAIRWGQRKIKEQAQ